MKNKDSVIIKKTRTIHFGIFLLLGVFLSACSNLPSGGISMQSSQATSIREVWVNMRTTINDWDYTYGTTLAVAGEANNDGTRNIYISADRGSDDGDGTQSRPFLKIFTHLGTAVRIHMVFIYEVRMISPFMRIVLLM